MMGLAVKYYKFKTNHYSEEKTMSQAPMSPDISSDDKLWAMLGYLFPIIAVIVLFMEDKKSRPYIKFNAVQSIAATVAFTIISTVTLGCGSIIFFVMLWWAYQAYQGQDIKVPMISDFIRNQGWA